MRDKKIFQRFMAAGLCALLLCGILIPALSEQYRELRRGMEGEDVQALKKAMYWLGYFKTDDLDGHFTATTEERVKQLQKNNGLKQTGVADADLQALVFSGRAVKTDTAPSPSPVPPPTPVPSPTPEPTPFPYSTEGYRSLEEGMTGEDVQALKKAMYWLGYFNTENLTDDYNKTTVDRVKQLQKANGFPETGVASPELQALVFSGNAVKTKTAPKPSPVVTPSPTPKPPFDVNAVLPPLNESGFLNEGEPEFVYADEEEGAWVYVSSSLYVCIERKQDLSDKKYPIVWFEGDIRCAPASPLTAWLTQGSKYQGKSYSNPRALARQNQAVVAFADDNFGDRWNGGSRTGVIIRSGEIIGEKTYNTGKTAFPNLEVLAQFADGTLKTFASDAHTAQEYLDMGVINTYAFGPILIQDGELSEYMLREEYYTYREPRCALGMIAPWHYYLLVVRGRADDSKGVFLTWLADNMLAHGVTEALNLDGGGTTALMFMGELINKKFSNEIRRVTSVSGFGVSDLVPEK